MRGSGASGAPLPWDGSEVVVVVVVRRSSLLLFVDVILSLSALSKASTDVSVIR